jgi:hypothetical protein
VRVRLGRNLSVRMMARINPPHFHTDILFKQLAHRFTGGAAGDAAANALGHLFRAATGDRLNIAKQMCCLVEQTSGFIDAHSYASSCSLFNTIIPQFNIVILLVPQPSHTVC